MQRHSVVIIPLQLEHDIDNTMRITLHFSLTCLGWLEEWVEGWVGVMEEWVGGEMIGMKLQSTIEV